MTSRLQGEVPSLPPPSPLPPALRRVRARLGLAVLEALCFGLPVAAQSASLVRDIHRGDGSWIGSEPGPMWTFQGKVLFAAREPSSGRELWITDGQASGTHLLADLFPGSDSSNPRILGTAGSQLFGIAFHDESCCGSSSRSYLWRSDGTREGTILLPDPNFRVALPFEEEFGVPAEGPVVPLALTGDGAYFSGCREGAGCALWRTDGTPEGTRILRQFGGSVFGGGPSELTLTGGRLTFSAGLQLWTSDGTPEGTSLVRGFSPTAPRRLAPLGNRVLFVAPAAPPETGEELWVSDGTAAGTHALTHFEAVAPFVQTRFLKNLGDRVYFVADDVTHGAELWSSDGTPAGTVRITDFGFFDPFNGDDGGFGDGLSSRSIDRLGDRLIFWASDGLSGFRPWSNQGTVASTAPLCTGCVFQRRSVPFEKLNGKLLFRAEDSAHGSEVWATDGTVSGTRLIRDACPGTCDGAGSELALLPGAVFFQGPGVRDFDRALWTSDGTPRGTRRFATAKLRFFAGPLAAAALGGRVLFGALASGDSLSGNQQELWTSDGTPAGTRQVSGNSRSGASAEVAELVAAGGQVFFTATGDGDSHTVWRSAGNAGDTLQSPEPVFHDFGEGSRLAVAGGKVFLVQEHYPLSHQLWRVGDDGQAVALTQLPDRFHIFDTVSYQGRLYFVVAQDRNFTPSELWQSDGTPEGTHRAVDLAGLEGVGFLKVLGQDIWLLGHDDATGAEIWRTDGTQAGTRLVHDFALSRSFDDPEFTQVGSTVYFVALQRIATGGFDDQIWKSDGTPQGTAALTALPRVDGLDAEPAELTAFQGNLYFFANGPDPGRALWRSDGTTLGTVPLRVFLLPESSTFDEEPRYGLTALGSRLVFSADDGVHGREPWSSDGTAAGTVLLRDVWPGPASSAVTRFTEAGGLLYFAAHDGAHGFEPWRTDGTPAGTRLVQDVAPEGASSYPAGFTVAAGRLFFGADDGLTGNELWALPLSGPACQPSGTALCLQAGRFKVEAFWRLPGENFGPGETGVGHAVPLSADTGYFWFFDPANVEAVLKVLDGQGVNGHAWVFYGALSNVEYTLTVTDTQTGLARRYVNPQGQLASVGDTQAFGPQGARARRAPAGGASPPLASERLDPSAATGTCVPAPGRLCLTGGRFAVEAAWKDFAGGTGTGTAAGLTGDTGYFWFFDAANVEVVLKVLDGNAVNGHFWVFYGALSNVEYTLTVTDTLTGTVKSYRNPSGRFASAADTLAF